MIICSGENLIDFVPNSEDSESFKACVGGSPLNTAIGLGAMKTPVYFFSRISNDFFGKKIISFLKKHNVKTNLIQKTSDKTTLGFISNKKKPEQNNFNFQIKIIFTEPSKIYGWMFREIIFK